MTDRPTAPTPAIDAAREWLLERANQMLVPTPRETVAFVTDTELAALLATREAALLERAQRAEAELEGRPCMGGNSAGGMTPTDCDWPFCGCDPKANRIAELFDDKLQRAEASVAALRKALIGTMRHLSPDFMGWPDQHAALTDTAAAAEAFVARVRQSEREALKQYLGHARVCPANLAKALNPEDQGWVDSKCSCGFSAIAAAIRSAPGDEGRE